MATTVTSKGQVTIPKPVRDRLGIKPGNAVEFELARMAGSALRRWVIAGHAAGSRSCAVAPDGE